MIFFVMNVPCINYYYIPMNMILSSICVFMQNTTQIPGMSFYRNAIWAGGVVMELSFVWFRLFGKIQVMKLFVDIVKYRTIEKYSWNYITYWNLNQWIWKSTVPKLFSQWLFNFSFLKLKKNGHNRYHCSNSSHAYILGYAFKIVLSQWILCMYYV